MKTLISTAVASVFLATTAVAQQTTFSLNRNWCIPTEAAFATAEKELGQTPLVLGSAVVEILGANGEFVPMKGMFTLFVNQDTGTFTPVVTNNNGLTCILADGKDFTPFTGSASDLKPSRPPK